MKADVQDRTTSALAGRMRPRKLSGWLLAGAALLALAAFAIGHKLLAPPPGRVLAFEISEASIDGPSRAAFVVADVSFEAGTPDDFAATAIAIATAVPADDVIVSVERNDLSPSAGHWRRTLARVEYRPKDKKPLAVSTPRPLLSAKEIAASIEYTDRAGLALDDGGQPMSSDADAALVQSLAAKHGVSPQRVGVFTPLRRERGDISDWSIIPGPGTQHSKDLAACYAAAKRGSEEWKSCK